MSLNPSPSKKGKRTSLVNLFSDLASQLSDLAVSADPSRSSSPPDKDESMGSFSRGWPPSSGSMRDRLTQGMSSLPFTLRMSKDYRFYDDRWRTDSTVMDEPLNVPEEFNEASAIMAEITSLLASHVITSGDLHDRIMNDMAMAVFGSNNIDRLGRNLDETYRMCLEIFKGNQELKIGERSEEYQAKLDAYTIKNVGPGQVAVMRSRREVIQHAAAFERLVRLYVKEDKPMSQDMIKETHALLVRGSSAQDAGIISNKSFGGHYRSTDAFARALQYTKPSMIPQAMAAFVRDLEEGVSLENAQAGIDRFMLAAKFCDRFVNIHPFRDGNGRMCRLILNAVLIKYAGIVVVLGEKDDDRGEYLMIAQESTKVGGHGGQLGHMVLKRAGRTLRGLRSKLKGKT